MNTASPPEEGRWQEPAPEESVSHTHAKIRIGDETIRYRASAGTYVLTEDNGQPRAQIFYVAYTRLDTDQAAARPVAFCFNGGPGSSSVWLHMGCLGPRKVNMEDGLDAPQPPFSLVDNAWSILDATDLVFIDPVSTGYSRPAPEKEARTFHGVEPDVESVGDFIRLWTSREKRWASPKFLIGESYGTTRAALLGGHLQEKLGMYLNGIALVSVVLDFSTIRFNIGNDLPFLLYVPTFAATARYHDRIATALPTLLTEAEEFALGDYATALLQGSALSAERKRATIQRLAALTGLDEAYVERSNLRIEIMRFAKELLRTERKTVGRFDSRITGQDRDAAGEHYEIDPSHAVVHGAFTGVFNDYVRNELHFNMDRPYTIIAELYQNWDYSRHANRYLNVAETLRSAMVQNPHLKVLAACGLYDMATPYFATEYTFRHMGLPPELQDNVHITRYPAGHMMYVHRPSLEQFKADLAAFIQDAA